MNQLKYGTFTASLLLCACTTQQPEPGDLIPISQLVNSMKCEFATFLNSYDGDRLQLRGWAISGAMDLNVATESTVGGGVKAGGLVPFQGAVGSLGFQGSVTRKNTINSSIGFLLESEATDMSVCDAAQGLSVQGGLGFGQWLSLVADGLDASAAGQPRFAVNKLTYELIFGVERSAGGEGSLTIVPLTLSAKALATRNDIQGVKVELLPPASKKSAAKSGGLEQPGLKPFSVPLTLRPFSPLVVPGS